MTGARSQPRRARRSRSRGSVLVPVVAAMLILLLSGVALAELFGAQRMRSVLTAHSTQARWVAEAGLWHAAHEGTALSTAISFAGGSYTVSKSGDDYTATGLRQSASRVVTLTLTSSGGGGGGSPADPLDEAASAATATRKDAKKAEVDLVSISSSDAVIASFALSADVGTEKLKKLKLDNKEIWKENAGVNLPTGVLALNKGSTNQRTVEAGDDPTLRLEFKTGPSGTITYTLVLDFTDTTSSTIEFSISW